MRVQDLWLGIIAIASLSACLGEDPSQRSDEVAAAPPRMVAPLAGATLTSRRPVLRWGRALAGLRVEICADRACAQVEQSLVGYGRSARPTGELATGVHFWRLVAGARATTAWSFVVPARDTTLSNTTGYVPDYDGDGIPDLAVSAPGTFRDPRGTAPRGFLHVFYGRRPLSSGTVITTPDATFGDELPDGGNAIGLRTAANLGDVNGDGYGDLAVSADDSIFVYHGGPDGLTTYASRLAANEYARGAGDVNADGYADAIVGRSLYLGSVDGLSASPLYTWVSGGDPVALGDVNGDGFADVGVFDGGRPVASLGAPAGLSGRTRTVWLARGFVLRAFVNAGDLNADGVSDLACEGSTPDGAAAVFVYLGTPSGYRRTADTTLAPTTDRTLPFGAVMSSAGDVNGDGFDDLMVRGDRIPTNDVFVSVYLGGIGGVATSPATVLAGRREVRYGSALSRLGDLDGDRHDDAVVTRAAVSDFVGGQALVHFGTATAVETSPSVAYVLGSSRDMFAQQLAGWN